MIGRVWVPVRSEISLPSFGFTTGTGVVMHRPHLFGGPVILDQSWALDAVYAVFHRQRTAPELLPEWGDIQDQLLGRLRDEPPVVQATVSFAFLHEGVLRGFMSKLGELAKDAPIYWKYGCWFFEGATRCEVLIESQLATDPSSARGTITLKSWTHGATGVLERLLEILTSQPLSVAPQITRSWSREIFAEVTTELSLTTDGTAIGTSLAWSMRRRIATKTPSPNNSGRLWKSH